MQRQQHHAIDIAKYFIGTADYDAGDNITQLKLQKLLYYAQGFHIAMHNGEGLFAEPLLAWDHGPVVRRIWYAYNAFSYQALPAVPDFSMDNYPPEVQELLNAVNCTYGQFTAKHLERMTHKELPWLQTPKDSVISKDLMLEYFSTLVDAGRKGVEVPGHPMLKVGEFQFQKRRSISQKLDRHRGKLRAIADSRPKDFNPWSADEATID